MMATIIDTQTTVSIFSSSLENGKVLVTALRVWRTRRKLLQEQNFMRLEKNMSLFSIVRKSHCSSTEGEKSFRCNSNSFASTAVLKATLQVKTKHVYKFYDLNIKERGKDVG